MRQMRVRVAALAGGVGAAKFLKGLVKVVRPDDLSVIGNVGDNVWVQGLLVAPDIDIVTYALAGIWDSARGWGIKGESFCARDHMLKLGGTEFDWFTLGDADLATCVWRTNRIRAGEPLSAVTREIKTRLGVASNIIPCTDHELTTHVKVDGRWVSFEEYYVKMRSAPAVEAVEYSGSDKASPAPGIVDALERADLVIVCPSNPVASIAPILSVPGLRNTLVHRRDSVVAISPIVGGKTLKGPADKMMSATGAEPSAAGVAKTYSDFVSTLVIDRVDAGLSDKISAMNVRPVVTNTIMDTDSSTVSLAQAVMDLA